MVPGTSRSAVTIVGAMLLGSSRLAAVEFSFFLAIPTMIAASAFSVLQMGFNMSSDELIILATGFLTSFVVALAVIRFLLRYIATRDFRLFGYYRIVLGSAVFAYFLFKP
jgi:undecaprenyl-diphosphatase